MHMPSNTNDLSKIKMTYTKPGATGRAWGSWIAAGFTRHRSKQRGHGAGGAFQVPSNP